MEARYDKSSVDSILEYAKGLTGKSLAEVEFIPREIVNSANKGDLGSLVEAFYFFHKPGNDKRPDFPEAGLELKTTGVLPHPNSKYKAKERLVLTMINYEDIVSEDWENSTLLTKCGLMLILFYLYEKDRPVVDRRFVLNPLLYRMLGDDWPVIKRDWETIRQKVRDGKAHELSEGDTNYLGACRKGAGGPNEPLRRQPFSAEGAKARAFSFKTEYMNHLIQGHLTRPAVLGLSEGLSLEDAVSMRFQEFINESIAELSNQFGIEKISKNQKGFYRQLAVRMLANGGNSVPELDKAGIEMKTIRLTPSGRPRESMSFPGFKFLDIVKESWEDSAFFEKIEKKFLFVVFQTDKAGVERFRGSFLWNMPYEDRIEAKRVWEETKRRVAIDATDLPKTTESLVAHVRPKARDGKDKIQTPQGTLHVKQAFWINSSYLQKVVDFHLR